MFTTRPSASPRRSPAFLAAVVLASAAGIFMAADAAQRDTRPDPQKGSPSLNIRTIVIPANDPGKFNLLIDGSIAGTGANVGNGGMTGMVNVGAGSHTVGVTAGAGTSLINYTVSYSANCAGGHISLSPGVSAICTITNARKLVQAPSQIRPEVGAALQAMPSTLTVTKTIVPSSATGTFRLMIDGYNPGTGGNVGNGGTTGAVVVEATPHVVTEAASPGTNLADYTAVFGGDCNPTGHVTLAAGEAKTCTITNTLKVTHGTWTHGPGMATFTVCAYGTPCNVNGAPGASVTITVEAWGAGGGGGSGQPGGDNNPTGGNGGGGGGGGGYAKTTITAVVPTSGTRAYYVKGGSGGAASASFQHYGADGEFSEVRVNSAAGPVVLHASGGKGGMQGSPDVGSGKGRAGGTGTINNWAGLAGGDGAIVSGCNGGAGGLGGPGGGPGRTGPGYYNDGGNGGHGGYYHSLFFPTCTAQSHNNGLALGMTGGNGLVRFAW